MLQLLTLPEHLSLPPVFTRVRVARSLVFMCMFCRSFFICLSFFIWPGLSILLRFTASDYPFFFFYLQTLLIILL